MFELLWMFIYLSVTEAWRFRGLASDSHSGAGINMIIIIIIKIPS
jgi:hypothetical protein